MGCYVTVPQPALGAFIAAREPTFCAGPSNRQRITSPIDLSGIAAHVQMVGLQARDRAGGRETRKGVMTDKRVDAPASDVLIVGGGIVDLAFALR